MKGENFRVPSTRGDVQLSCWRWMPEGEPKAVLQLSHGMCEHITRYSDFAEFLCSRGFAVYGHDHLGHGDTTPEDLGFFADEDGDTVVLDDVFEVTKRIESDLPGKPVFLLGHSMGSFIARRYLTKYGDHLSGAIIMGTGQQSPFVLKMGMSMANRDIKKNGLRSINKMLNDTALGNNDKKFKGSDLKNRWLSRDTANVEKYNADDFCGYQFTSAGFRDLFAMIRKLEDKVDFDRIPKDLPILLTSGGSDPVGECGKAVERARKDLADAGLRPEMKLYEGARHEILNETNRQEVYGDILGWLEGNLPQN